jgi:hypothetical protein
MQKIPKAWIDTFPAKNTRIEDKKHAPRTQFRPYKSKKEDPFYWLTQRRSMTSPCFITTSHPRQKHLPIFTFEGISDFPRAQKSAPGD